MQYNNFIFMFLGQYELKNDDGYSLRRVKYDGINLIYFV